VISVVRGFSSQTIVALDLVLVSPPTRAQNVRYLYSNYRDLYSRSRSRGLRSESVSNSALAHTIDLILDAPLCNSVERSQIKHHGKSADARGRDSARPSGLYAITLLMPAPG